MDPIIFYFSPTSVNKNADYRGFFVYLYIQAALDMVVAEKHLKKVLYLSSGSGCS